LSENRSNPKTQWIIIIFPTKVAMDIPHGPKKRPSHLG